jgi:hypothetical protein
MGIPGNLSVLEETCYEWIKIEVSIPMEERDRRQLQAKLFASKQKRRLDKARRYYDESRVNIDGGSSVIAKWSVTISRYMWIVTDAQ